ncbi:MAG: hypothetical protein H0V88_12675, partial [Pyrinomonadaceae bacterium]|nr:hypothetical protein [Pyrinomonadaceae bacterium]
MHQALRPIAVMLGVILVITVPAQAAPVRLIDVVQTITNNDGARQNAQLQLRHISQQSDTLTASGIRVPDVKDASQTNSTGSGVPAVVSGKGGVPQGGSRQDVETIQLGDVSGTICDCGEIVIPGAGGGFPLWPLFGLAAIPLAFLDFGGGSSGSPPFVIPAPTTPVPTTPVPT